VVLLDERLRPRELLRDGDVPEQVGYRRPEEPAQAGIAERLGSLARVDVHRVDGGDAAAEEVQGGQFVPRPREVVEVAVAESAVEGRHGRQHLGHPEFAERAEKRRQFEVRVRVDEARHHHRPRAVHESVRRTVRVSVARPPHVADSSVLDDDRPPFVQAVPVVHREDGGVVNHDVAHRRQLTRTDKKEPRPPAVRRRPVASSHNLGGWK
jgi:hypothetical protein